MEKGKGKEMKEAMVHKRKSYACMSSPDLSVGDNMTPAVEKKCGKTEFPKKREANKHCEAQFLIVGAKQDEFHRCHKNGDIRDSKARSLSS